MFNTVLPGMEKCVNVLSNENGNKLYAKCLISERKKTDEFYVLENLNCLGYACADRIKGLDLEHALVLMKKIGASDVTAQAIAVGGSEYVSKMLESWPLYKHLSQRVQSIIPKFNNLVMKAVNPKNSKFNVINHGDLWVNNFLYKYDKDSEKPIDVVFVDFQNCFWGSCGFDINWFLNTSLQLKVLKEKRPQLIQNYYESLKKTLCKENFPKPEIPTCEDVLVEIHHCEIIGLYTSLCELPIVALEKSKSQDFDSNTFSQPEKMAEIRALMYENPRVKECLKFTLKYFEEINLL